MNIKKNYLAGGNSGVLLGVNIISKSSQSCPRKIYARACGFDEPIDDRAAYTFKLGFVNEEVFKERNPTWKTSFRMDEMPTPFPEMFPDFKLGLEADAVRIVDDKITHIAELKSVSSTTTLKEVFAEGKPKFDNLVQLLHYLTWFDVDKGYLIYTNFIYHTFTFKGESFKKKAGDKKMFNIEKRDCNFLVDGEKSLITTTSIKNYAEYIACVLDGQVQFTDVLIPVDIEKQEKIACQWCPLKPFCEASGDWEDWLRNCLENNVLIERVKGAKI